MRVFRFFFITVLLGSSLGFSIDKGPLIKALEDQNVSEVISFFESIETITWNEASELISDLYGYYISQYGVEILEQEEYVKSFERCKAVYNSILEAHGVCLENYLIRNGDGIPHSLLLCGKKKDKAKTHVEAEIPTSVILGAVEILGGALVWILPFPGTKVAGGAMIGDGIRRTFNGLEELDAENKLKTQ